MSALRGSGTCVVEVCPGGEPRYRVCVEALRGVVASRAELRGLPVALVSVAGATRTGKSFLLDFFLRYLSATLDQTEAGSEDEPLTGFRWRGGCDRETSGIQLWSEPIVVCRQDGQKMAVLLMDTQGTFDSISTLRDSTTIFAMSTLLSSVQIYNLSMNILEDHLQYLQLFTEYGKLASDGAASERPFQLLQFLVRDWSYGYQHAAGAGGGQELLDKRLQLNDSQVTELREVRQHVQSCFESVRCFLMPHPGLTVAADPDFDGRLSDMSKEFKKALLGLVKEVFEESLSAKKINGQELQLQELVTYFESYIDVFNSDLLPSPVSILKATSSAALESALCGARALYESRMALVVGDWCVPRDVVWRAHKAAKDAARLATLKMATRLLAPDQLSQRLDTMLQELDALLPQYVALNQTKVQSVMEVSKSAYSKHMLESGGCLLAGELTARLAEALAEAMAVYDRASGQLEVTGSYEVDDTDRKHLQMELNTEFREHFELMNQSNIIAAMTDAMDKYVKGVCRGHEMPALCVSPNHLLYLHRTAKDNALEVFDERWLSQESALNEHRTALLGKINEKFIVIKSLNEPNNENAVQNALQFYRNGMSNDVLGTNLCLHALDFEREHSALYRSTLAEFYRTRTFGDDFSGRDNYKLKLLQEIPALHVRFTKLNEQMNKAAVKTAHAYYEMQMRIQRGLNGFLEFFGPPDFDVISRHSTVEPQALNMFKNELRKHGRQHNEDKHLDELKKLITSSYDWLLAKLVGTVFVNVASIASLATRFLR